MTDEIEIIKEEHVLSSNEKLFHFGYGEWVEEADFIEFIYKKYECRILRRVVKESDESLFGGNLCGYVRIPVESHIYDQELDLDCHWGITYDQKHEDRWIGFDCAHSGDYVPSLELFRIKNKDKLEERFPIPEELKKYGWFNPEYRNISFCISQCKSMIEQILVLEELKKT